jgi:hypothetical protein
MNHSRTRPADPPTRWSVYGPIVDKICLENQLVVRLLDSISQTIARRMHVAENLCDLLYCLLRAYPVPSNALGESIQVVASRESKEGFKRFVMENLKAREV